MKYLKKKISDIDYKFKNTAVTIGKFDGIHKGHKLLIDKVAKSQKESVMFTFLFEDSKQIYTSEEKRKIVEKLGIDIMIECPFDDCIKKMTYKDFVKEILHDLLDCRLLVVGKDFRFGYNREGTIKHLEEYKKIYNFELVVVDKLSGVSSTIIKDYLANADIKKVNGLLTRNVSIEGVIEHGNAIGRTIGIPTINIIPCKDKLLAKNGVYSSIITIDDKTYNGITNIGYKPTIQGEKKLGVETNIFDFNQDVYGKYAKVELTSFIRGEVKFDSIEALVKQMNEDILLVKKGG